MSLHSYGLWPNRLQATHLPSRFATAIDRLKLVVRPIELENNEHTGYRQEATRC